MRRGMALIAVLVLAAVVLALSAVILKLVTTESRIAGIETRYTSSLEVAKGISELIMKLTRLGEDEFCKSYTTDRCKSAKEGIREEIKLPKEYKKLGDYEVKASLLGLVEEGGAIVYAVEVEVKNRLTGRERSTVDYVYRVE
jgi:single-stranded DNA-specific DHH superfamily exonuclease